MRARMLDCLKMITAFLLAGGGAPVAAGPASGFYQIVSGRYSQCCGIGGNPTGYDLPSPAQTYIKLTVDAQSGLASMSFLGADLRTVFSIAPCPSGGPVEFRFDYGFSFPDRIEFHVDPGPPPYGVYWNYTVSNAGPALRIDGQLGMALSQCADVPTRFGHSNVVAVLIPPPRLSVRSFSNRDGLQLLLQGRAGHTNVIEASSDLITWEPVATNVMDFSLCPICPYFLYQDPGSTNLPWRFYRAFELP